MDLISILSSFFGALDLVIVVGIILIFALAIRPVLKAQGVSLTDAQCRLIVLGLGVVCAFLKADYKDGVLAEFLDLARMGIAYGGAATLLYQLWRAGAKRFFPPEDAKPADDLTTGVPGS